MMGACMRKGMGLGLGMSAAVVALPACLALLWVAMGCMWVVGLVSVIKLLWRLMWRTAGGGDSKRKEEAQKRRLKKMVELKEAEEEESAAMRLSLFHQYLEDQLNTLAHQLLHVYSSDSMPSSHVDICNSPALEEYEECVQGHRV